VASGQVGNIAEVQVSQTRGFMIVFASIRRVGSQNSIQLLQSHRKEKGSNVTSRNQRRKEALKVAGLYQNRNAGAEFIGHTTNKKAVTSFVHSWHGSCENIDLTTMDNSKLCDKVWVGKFHLPGQLGDGGMEENGDMINLFLVYAGGRGT
jgi:hypothetical protein